LSRAVDPSPSRAVDPSPSRAVEPVETGPDPWWVLGGATLLAVLAGLVWASRRRS
jgi:MYXO-CTERM domain-containing protein